MRRIGFVAAVLSLAIVAFVAGAGTRRTRGADPRPRATAKVPGIVLICLDTLRADAIDADPVSAGLPSLRAWARGATTFTDAVAPSSWTLPSVTSILTGLHATTHGVLDMTTGARLSGAVPTLARLLHEAGFATAACTGGGWVSPDSGLGTGFEHFHVDFDQRPPAQAVVRFAREVDATRPFFLLLHSYGAHDPYGDKTPYFDGPCGDADGLVDDLAAMLAASRPFDAPLRQQFLLASLGDPCRRVALQSRLGHVNATNLWLEGCRPWIDGGWRLENGGPETVGALRTAYRRGLRAVDARLREVLDALAALPEETVVIVTGDHGEAFGEHGPIHHGRYLFREFVHVPLVIRAGSLPRQALVPGPCSLVDLVPTCLELAGVTARGPFDGTSLVALATGTSDVRHARSIVAPGEAAAGGEEVHRRRVAVRDATLAWIGTLDVRSLAWVEERWFDRVDGVEGPVPRTPPAALARAFRDERRRARADLEARYRPWRKGP